MRHRAWGRSAVSRGFAAPLAIALLAGFAALAACGELDDATTCRSTTRVRPRSRPRSDPSTTWAGSSTSIATRAAAVQESIADLAAANRADVAAWQEEWAELQSAHAAAVAEVEYYNATVAHPELKAFLLDWDPVTMTMSGTEVVKEEAVPAKPLPAAPQPPPAVTVELGPIRRQIDGLEALLGRLEAALCRSEAELAPSAQSGAAPATSLTFVAVTDVARLLAVANAQAALATAADRLEQVLADVRATLDKGITSDPQMGDVCAKALTKLELSAAGAVEQARAALTMAAAENGVDVAGLPWASSTPVD